MGPGYPVQELTERQACMILNALPERGPFALHRLLAEFGGNLQAVLAHPSVAAWVHRFNLAREEERLARSGVAFVALTDAGYPNLLRKISHAPFGFYRKGNDALAGPCVAIVGSRNATFLGREFAKKLGADLAGKGVCVVSGLARGIDTAAHQGALEADGRTVAVLGTGIDRIYPPENIGLFRRLAETGAIISEYPLGARTTSFSFPMRNRIISGLCAAVVVVESAPHGGAMITSRFAREQGRPVFVVLDGSDQAATAGCRQLLRDGAIPLRALEDILSKLSPSNDGCPRGHSFSFGDYCAHQ